MVATYIYTSHYVKMELGDLLARGIVNPEKLQGWVVAWSYKPCRLLEPGVFNI